MLKSHAERRAGALAVLLLLAFAGAYAPVTKVLWSQWATNDTYSFGVLVPLISGYLIWSRRGRLRALAVSPSLAAGCVVVVAAAGLLLLGRMSAIVAFQEMSLVIMLVGLVLLVLGWAFLRALWFPLAYLLLMLPVWEVVTDPLHQPAQLFSAATAEWMLTSLGVPVYRQGVLLDLPSITLEVASACSGVNFLIAVVAVGIPQAYLYLRGWLPRLVLIGLAVSIALFSNGVRVAVIGLLWHHELSDSVHGPAHILQGLFVSGFGFVALAAAGAVLAKRYPRAPEAAAPARQLAWYVGVGRWRVTAALATAIVALLTLSMYQPQHRLAAAGVAADGPLQLGAEWVRLPQPVPGRFVSGPRPWELTSWVYTTAEGDRVELFVRDLTEIAADGNVAYLSVELPSDSATTSVTLSPERGRPFVANRALLANAASEIEVIYWYDVGGRPIALGQTAKAYATSRLLFRRGDTPRLVVTIADRPAGTRTKPHLPIAFALDVSQALSKASASAELTENRP